MKEKQPAVIKYQLGWKFTEEDERRADLAIRHANEYMKTYGKGGVQLRMLNHANYIHAPEKDGADIGE